MDHGSLHCDLQWQSVYGSQGSNKLVIATEVDIRASLDAVAGSDACQVPGEFSMGKW